MRLTDQQILADSLVATGERLWSTAQGNTLTAMRIRQWMWTISNGTFVLELRKRGPAIDRVGELIAGPHRDGCTIRTVDGRELSWTNCGIVRIPRTEVEEREISKMAGEELGSKNARRNYAHARGPGYSVDLNVEHHDDERISIAAAGGLDIDTATMLRDGLSAWIDLRSESARLRSCTCWRKQFGPHHIRGCVMWDGVAPVEGTTK